MSIPDLVIIGESINDSVPSTHALFEENNVAGLIELARLQAEKGAAYIDVNVGRRSPGFMAELVKKIQEHISLPLSIDTPDPEIAAAGLRAYDPGRAGNQKPILNSISEARLEMFDFYKSQPFIPILLVTEGLSPEGELVMNKTADQELATAHSIVTMARERIPGVPNRELILDPGIMPIGSDSQGDLKRLMAAMALIHKDKDLEGINMSVGLSNFTQMLPSKKADGSPVKGPLESAFLTLAMPLGLNMIIGSVHRKYALLSDEHPAMQCVREALNLEGFDVIMRVMSFYS
ncbi:MAG TPA: dihydropteroate synthase [bacterium]|nr:dihydropteroate synthase [bacterium]HQG45652.1 dihydropteroate synthase [bacterium]HQI49383.1 dihydropteroate synthase [bacterium]HQJ66245.1 dihydropteroate synthase [bacterium]